jgi:Xaa-Pro aminopeptidase
MADDLLLHASTDRSPHLRHEIAATVGDPFLYGEHEGRSFAVVSALDANALLGARPELELLDPFALGLVSLIEGGLDRPNALDEVALRACRQVGVTAATVPRDFPLGLADRLRAGGIELTVDEAVFDGRRRVKGPAQLAGIRRAAATAQAGMAAAAALLASAASDDPDGLLRVDGEVLTSERLTVDIRAAVESRGGRLDQLIAAGGAQGALGHHPGAGPLRRDEPIVVDLWPQDLASGCWADMTRTFVVGTPSDDVVRWHNLARDALARSVDALAAGISGRELWEIACDVLEAAGEPTQRDPGGRPAPLVDGFFYSLGHGVGLEVHEAPALGLSGRDPLLAGDVVAIEPGTGRRGVGAARVEDLYLVTEEAAELLTPFSYEMDPGA